MAAHGLNLAVLHQEDPVGVLHRGHPLGNDDLGGLGDKFAESLADEGVGAGVHRAGGVVQNQNLGLFQQGPGNAQPLLLAAGHVGAALLDVGVILLGELLDELVRLREAAGLFQFLVGGMGIAPAQVLLDRAGEQLVLLQHHGHLVAQGFQVIVPHVHAAHLHGALGGVIQAGDQLDQRGLRGARPSQNAHNLAALDVQVNVREGVAAGLFGVLKVHMVKVDGAVLDLHDGVFRVLQGALFRKDLHNTLGGLQGHGDHHEDHGDHHQAHQNLEGVGEQRGHLPHVQVQALAGDDGVRAKGHDENHHHIDAELHQGVVDGQNALGLGKVLLHVLGGAVKLFLLVVFPHIGLDHPHAPDVFLHRGVQGVVLAEHPAEQGHGLFGDEKQPNAQHGDGEQKDEGHFPAHDKTHNKGEDEH